MAIYLVDLTVLQTRFENFKTANNTARQLELLTTLWGQIISNRVAYLAETISDNDAWSWVQTWVRMARWADAEKYNGLYNINYGTYYYDSIWNEGIIFKELGSGSPRETTIINAVTDITS